MRPELEPQNRFKTELCYPERPITADEIEFLRSLRRDSTQLVLAGQGEKLPIRSDFVPTSSKNGQGEAFFYTHFFDGVNGTFLGYDGRRGLLSFLRPNVPTAQAEEMLTGDKFRGDGEPLLKLRSPGGFLSINVFGGATHEAAISLAQIPLRDGGLEDDENRGFYHRVLYPCVRPVDLRPLESTLKDLNLSCSGDIFIVPEDCMATVISMVGTREVLQMSARNNGFQPAAGMRIDLAEVTTHSLIFMGLEADESRKSVEVNVAFVQAGLTEGIGPKKEHKHYITPHPRLSEAYKGAVLAVNDMGTAAMRVGGLDEEKFRRDNWRPGGPTENYSADNLDRPGPLVFGPANGTLLRLAQRSLALTEAGRASETEFPTIVAVEKRVDGGKAGFAVRFDHFLEPYLDYLSKR